MLYDIVFLETAFIIVIYKLEMSLSQRIKVLDERIRILGQDWQKVPCTCNDTGMFELCLGNKGRAF
jgi:hypothetical protein